MGSFEKITTILLIPIFIINMLGGIISGIWLAILGEWGLIGYGLLALIISSFIIGIALIPAMIFAAPSIALIEKGHKFIGYIIGMLGMIYTIGILSAWCLVVLITYMREATPDSIIPVLIWSYGVATGPISYMAQKEMQSGNEFSGITTFFLQIAYIITILAILFIRINFFDVLVIFGVVMTVAIIIQSYLVYMDRHQY